MSLLSTTHSHQLSNQLTVGAGMCYVLRFVSHNLLTQVVRFLLLLQLHIYICRNMQKLFLETDACRTFSQHFFIFAATPLSFSVTLLPILCMYSFWEVFQTFVRLLQLHFVRYVYLSVWPVLSCFCCGCCLARCSLSGSKQVVVLLFFLLALF